LGTAGGVKACEDFIGTDDFLIISGDAACHLDLKKLIKAHYDKNAEVTIALYRSEKPLEYGLVMTDSDGRVERFIEKPSRDRVYTDFVNTGIYIISGGLLAEIPENTPYDFARDLFPILLSQNRRIYGIPFEGYWCDVGNCSSYLEANFDALSGNLQIQIDAPEASKNIWTKTALENDATFIPPCYIGDRVEIGKGTVIGPLAVISDGSTIGQDCRINNSVIDGALLEDRIRATGSIVCRNAKIGSDTVLSEGSVVGEGVAIGSGSLVSEGVRIWPNKNIPAGTKLKTSLITGMGRQGPMFEVKGVISGQLGLEVTPEICLSMGMAAGVKSAGIAHSGGEFARIFAECFGCGAASSGGQVFHLDATVPATASLASLLYKLDITLFAEQRGRKIKLWFFNNKGLPIGRDIERRLEGISFTDVSLADADGAGSLSSITGTPLAHCAAAADCAFSQKSEHKAGISVTGRSQAARLVRAALESAGFILTEPSLSTAMLSITPDGFSLNLSDEEGQIWEHDKLLTALALVQFEHGDGKAVLPYTAPAAAELLASQLGGKVLRLDRDRAEAEEMLKTHPFSINGVFLSVRLVSALQWYENSFAALMSQIPSFFTAKRELRISCDRGRLLRELTRMSSEFSAEFISGLKIMTDRGQAHIMPGGEGTISISAESATKETAQEICLDYEKKIREITNEQ
jgi:mannose-1-phosphate guanylyltransferase/phosphomannomutase